MPGDRFHNEREDLARRLDEVIRKYLADAGIPKVNDRGGYVFGDQSIGQHPSSREMRFFLDDLAAFTPELIARIQTEALSEYPRWTVVPQFHTREFTVSARSVRFGDRPVKGTVTASTPAYQEWLRESRAFDEESFGPARRIFQFVTSRVPGLLPRVERERFVFVAAVRKQDKAALVWLLMTPAVGNAVFRERNSPVCKHAVTADGVVYPEFCRDFSPYTDREPAAWLKLFDRANRTETEPKLVTPQGEPLGTVRIEGYLEETL